jgi:hypothetical protein
VVVRAAADRKLWAPGVVAPEYLNGTLAGESTAWPSEAPSCERQDRHRFARMLWLP